MYLWLYINHYLISQKECLKGIRIYKDTDLFGNSKEKEFRELLKSKGII